MLAHSLRRFARNHSGSTAVLFALSVVVMAAAIAVAIDYTGTTSAEVRFNSAADAAALAAITKTKTDLIAGIPSKKAIADGAQFGQSTFSAQVGAAIGNLKAAPTVDVTRSGQTLTATVSYQASRGTSLGSLLGAPTIAFNGGATATLTMATYLDFYLALDMSASMGIPSTPSEINRLAAINPDYRTIYPGGCTIACHFTAYQACTDASGNTSWCQGYNLTRTGGGSGAPVNFCAQPGLSNCIQLRLDAVIYALQQLLSTVQLTESRNGVPNEFRVGIYPFIAYLTAYQPLTKNMNAVSKAAADLPSLLDNGDPTNGGGLGSGGTHFDNALPTLNDLITNIGDGSGTASPKPFVFLITDGAQDPQYQLGNGSWTGSNHATTLDTSNCAAMKSRGVTVAVLYVPYVPIPNPTTIWNNEDGFANANIPAIPASLQACASPGFFFTASTPTDINNSLQAMFAMSLAQAKLTK